MRLNLDFDTVYLEVPKWFSILKTFYGPLDDPTIYKLCLFLAFMNKPRIV